MAVWQYQLNVIPKKAVLEKYGVIPDKLFIDKDGWEKYWENLVSPGMLPEPDFEDAKTIKWWKNLKVDIQKITCQIDKNMKRGDWGDDDDSGFIGWKGNSEIDEDNDGHIAYNKTTQEIKEFQFRADLRNSEKSTKFLTGMLNLCQQNEFMVFNTSGILFEPKFDLIFEDLKKSNAIAFLNEPEKFLDDIAKKNNGIRKVSFWTKIKTLLR